MGGILGKVLPVVAGFALGPVFGVSAAAGAAAGGAIGSAARGGNLSQIISGAGIGYGAGALASGAISGISASTPLAPGVQGPTTSAVGGLGVANNVVSGAFSGVGGILSKAGTAAQLAMAVGGGMNAPKPSSNNAISSAQTAAQTAQNAKEAAIADAAEKKRQKLLAMQQESGALGQLTPAGGVPGTASVMRKTLLGS